MSDLDDLAKAARETQVVHVTRSTGGIPVRPPSGGQISSIAPAPILEINPPDYADPRRRSPFEWGFFITLGVLAAVVVVMVVIYVLGFIARETESAIEERNARLKQQAELQAVIDKASSTYPERDAFSGRIRFRVEKTRDGVDVAVENTGSRLACDIRAAVKVRNFEATPIDFGNVPPHSISQRKFHIQGVNLEDVNVTLTGGAFQ